MHSFQHIMAYLDPGTGSIIIQAVVGAAAGIAIFGRKFFGNITHKVRSIFSRKNDDSKKEL